LQPRPKDDAGALTHRKEKGNAPLPDGGTNIRLFCFHDRCGSILRRDLSARLQKVGAGRQPDSLVQWARRRPCGGFGILAFEDEKDGDRRRKTEPEIDSDVEERPKAAKKKRPPTEVGQALRTVYQRTIDETIPPEMLDLLGKLG
jgi:hypothetical protein